MVGALRGEWCGAPSTTANDSNIMQRLWRRLYDTRAPYCRSCRTAHTALRVVVPEAVRGGQRVSPGGSISVLKARAFVRGSDIIMQYKADGSFGEAFELNNFPFDTQAMTVKFTVACANQGLTPVRISTDRAASGRAGAPA